MHPRPFFLLCANTILNTPGNFWRDTCPPVKSLIRNAASLLPTSLLSEGRAKLWALFKTQGSRRFLYTRRTQKVTNQQVPSLTPSLHLSPGIQQFSPRAFRERGKESSLPFPARVELRQLPALASGNPEREMQIMALGTVNKVLGLQHS